MFTNMMKENMGKRMKVLREVQIETLSFQVMLREVKNKIIVSGEIEFRLFSSFELVFSCENDNVWYLDSRAVNVTSYREQYLEYTHMLVGCLSLWVMITGRLQAKVDHYGLSQSIDFRF